MTLVVRCLSCVVWYSLFLYLVMLIGDRCCSLFVACCLLRGVVSCVWCVVCCCSLYGVCCCCVWLPAAFSSLFIVCGLSLCLVVCCCLMLLVVRCLLCVVGCCSLCVDCRVDLFVALFVVCWLLFVVGLLCGVCHVFIVVCCSLFIALCRWSLFGVVCCPLSVLCDVLFAVSLLFVVCCLLC